MQLYIKGNLHTLNFKEDSFINDLASAQISFKYSISKKNLLKL